MTIVNTNIQALFAQKALAMNSRALNDASAQLATGKRITSAADDASGVAIGSRMSTQIHSLNQAVRNTTDGISMMQTADGAAGGIQAMLYRMKELAVQAANDTYSDEGRVALDTEFQALETEIANTVANTSWNSMKLLDGSLGANSGIATFQVGALSGDGVEVTFADFDLSTEPLATAGRSVDTAANANTALETLGAAIDQVSSARATWGAGMNRLIHAGDNAAQVSQNLSASYSRIMDTDYAQATAELARAMILDQAGSAMLAQANQQPAYVLALLS